MDGPKSATWTERVDEGCFVKVGSVEGVIDVVDSRLLQRLGIVYLKCPETFSLAIFFCGGSYEPS